MAASIDLVISSEPCSTAMPAGASEFVLLVEGLRAQGVLELLQRSGPVRRADAADLSSIVLFLLAFFCLGGEGGLRAFDGRLARWRQRLAAAADLLTLPSSTAVSRGLAALRPEDVQALQGALLAASMQGTPLLNHALTTWRDSHGQPWCVVDLDPKVLALRQRALPESANLPEPVRRAKDFAAPGYPGRKRGDVIVSACRTQFSGSGLWVSLSMQPGNMPMAMAVALAVQDVREACRSGGVPLERTVMRIDGAGGNVPCVTALQESGMRYLTRSARYRLLDQPDVRQWLATAPWQPVVDSLSGPRREAVELGAMQWVCAKQTRQPDGEVYEPVSVRMVVSRFKPADPEHKHGSGVLLDGMHYELFGCNLPVDAWPAPAAVALYYGRSELENRFAQENREFGLNTVLSYNVPGQMLATLVGQCAWNYRIGMGAKLAGIAPDPAFDSGEDKVVWTLPTSAPAPQRPEQSAPQPPPAPNADPPLNLDDLDWEPALKAYPGWTRAPENRVQCPAGKTLRLHRQTRGKGDRVTLILRAAKTACRSCPIRSGCTQSTNAKFRKEISITLAPFATAATGPTTRESTAAPAWRPPPRAQVGGRAIEPPRLVPSELRRLWEKVTAGIETRIHLSLPPALQKPPAWIADGAARRQHRRRSWDERRASRQLPDSASVKIELRRIEGAASVRQAEREMRGYALKL